MTLTQTVAPRLSICSAAAAKLARIAVILHLTEFRQRAEGEQMVGIHDHNGTEDPQ